MKVQSGFSAFELLVAIIVVGGFTGWVMNIIKLFGESFDPLTGWAIGRVVGVFVAPLGAVLGWM